MIKKLSYLNFELFIVSFIVISNQIALMQFLAYQQWYHFASMIVSMALIGFGLSGIIINRIIRKLVIDKENIFDLLFIISAATIPFALIVEKKLIGSFDSYLIFFQASESIKFLLITFNFTLIFILLAVIIGLIFSLYPQNIGKLYFFNLIGSAAGGLISVLLLWILQPQQILFLNGLMISSVLLIKWLLEKRSIATIKKILIIFISVVTLMLLIFSVENEPSQFKAISKIKNIPDSKLIQERLSPYGKLEKFFSTVFRYAPGLSLNFTGKIPTGNLILINGEIVGFDISNNDNSKIEFLKNSTLFLPYLFPEIKDVLILNSSAGFEINRLLITNIKNSDVIEFNPLLYKMIEKKFKSAETKIIHFLNIDPVIYLYSINKKYDLIFYPAIEATDLNSGLYAIRENFFLTRETFQKLFANLKEDGYLTISCFVDKPLRSFARILNLILSIQLDSNQFISKENLIAINNWNLITIIAKKGLFKEIELKLVSEFCDKNQFDFLINPSKESIQMSYNLVFDSTEIDLISSILKRENKNLNAYLFGLETSDFDKPYFFNFIRLEKFSDYRRQLSMRSFTYSELGYFIIWFVALVISIISLILIFIGFSITKVSSPLKLKIFTYFTLIGLAYMIVEFCLIQKFTLILSTNVYAISFVISLLLISSGTGSLVSNWFLKKVKFVPLIFLIISILFAAYLIYFDFLTTLLLKNDQTLKFILSGLMIFFLGFMLGMPFPIGIIRFSNSNKETVSFAWLINGCYSVIGSIFTIILLVTIGFKLTFLIGGSIYFLLAIISIFFFKN